MHLKLLLNLQKPKGKKYLGLQILKMTIPTISKTISRSRRMANRSAILMICYCECSVNILSLFQFEFLIKACFRREDKSITRIRITECVISVRAVRRSRWPSARVVVASASVLIASELGNRHRLSLSVVFLTCDCCFMTFVLFLFRYPLLTFDDVVENCPYCRGNCNCKACLRSSGPIVVSTLT